MNKNRGEKMFKYLSGLVSAGFLTYIAACAPAAAPGENPGELAGGTPVIDGCFIADNTVCQGRNLSNQTTKLRQAHLNNAKLQRTTFAKSVLVNADLNLAILDGATMTETNLTAADLTDASIINVDLSNAILNQAKCIGTHFQTSQMNGVSLKSARCTNADFSTATLQLGKANKRPDFTSGVFEGATFTDSTIIEPVLNDGNFKSANFTNAIITKATGTKINMDGATFVDADFTEANVQGNFDNIRATRANFNQSTFTTATFQAAELRCANFASTSIANVDFERADLTGAVFAGANFGEAVDLENAIFCHTIDQHGNLRNDDPACDPNDPPECPNLACQYQSTQALCTAATVGGTAPACKWDAAATPKCSPK